MKLKLTNNQQIHSSKLDYNFINQGFLFVTNKGHLIHK